MNPKPSILNILINDQWAAPTGAASITAVSMAFIVWVVEPFTGPAKGVNPGAFLWMAGASLIIALITSIYRVDYVRQVFENGEIVRAEIIDRSVYRSNMRLKLRYFFHGETQEKKLEQLITRKTKFLLHEKDVTLMIDQKNPNRILLQDAYL